MRVRLRSWFQGWLWMVVAVALTPFAAVAQGILIPSDTALAPLALKYQRVSVNIQDGTAVTKVEQVFVNPSPVQLEAHYVFPLPKGAALSEFFLWIDGRKTRGEIMEKDKAANIYEGIVRRLKDPGLLEYIDTDVFRARVFPVPARGEQRIELTFSQVLDYSTGLYRYHYPLGAGRRLFGTVQQDFVFSANVSSKIPIRNIYSPTHPLQIARQGEKSAVVGLEQGPGTDISRDLDLYYSVSDKAVGLSLLSYKEPGEPGYFIALLSPKQDYQRDELSGKRITFVIDTSGSMAGERIKMAKQALTYCVTRLNPNDKFNVIRFATDVEALFERPVDATPAMIEKAQSFVRGMEAGGGTAIDEALKHALKDGSRDRSGPHLVMFITDGQPTIGETDENTIAAQARESNTDRSRLFTFGVGEDLNARLLDRLAAEGGGVSDYVKGGRDFEERISAFYDKVSHPVLSDVALDLSSFEAYDVYPRHLPDLFKGSQLVVVGRYRKAGDAKVRLTGTIKGEPRSYDYGATVPEQRRSEDFIPRLWAIRKVGYVLEEIRLHGEKPELKDEVVALAKKFGIVTPYTSYLAVEDRPPATPTALAPGEPLAPPMDAPGPMRHHAYAPSPSKKATGSRAPASEDEFASVFGVGGVGSGSLGIGTADGKAGIAVSKETNKMKQEERSPGSSEPFRIAAGKTYFWRGDSWADADASGAAKQLKIKYLSPAYFAFLRARPDLKGALALGDHVVMLVAKGKAVTIDPAGGEEKTEAVLAFLGP